MSLSTTSRKAGPYAGDAVTVAFAFAFKVFATTDLVVIKASSAGVETTLALGVGYTATMNADQDASPGGTVTAAVAPAVGEKLVITTAISALQSTTLLNGGGFFPAVLNAIHDRVTIFAQELREKISRAITIPISASGVTSLQIPVTANGIVAWNSAGTALTADPNAATVAQAGHAGEVLTTNGATSSWTSTLADFQINFLRFGAATNVNPALKKSGATLQARLADDSIYANLAGAVIESYGFSFSFLSRGFLNAPNDGVFTLLDAAGATFGRLQFGGTTASFPALKRSAAVLEARLADDSAGAQFKASDFINAAGGAFIFDTRSKISSTADGVINLLNAASTGFTQLNFGSATAAFPSFKRNSTAIDVRLADDSGYANLRGGVLEATSYVRTLAGTLAALNAVASAATAGVGARAFITDGATTVILGLGLTAVGGGANKVPVYSDGANWIVG